jgi:hypothetical protein
MSDARRYLWLLGILVAEAVLFVWKCNHFFNGDSLYFFSHQVGSSADVWRVFKGPDQLWQYRPLTFLIFSFFLKPLFGLNPLGYNLFPLFVHAANTLIVFGILRSLRLAERAALLGTFFFGAHCVAFYVTYGVAFLPDFSYSFFYLLSVFFFVKYVSVGSRGMLPLSLLAFVLALFCKEAASALAPLVFVIAFLWGKEGFRRPQDSFARTTAVAFRRTFPFLFLGVIYLGFHWMVKSGQIYAPGIDHPHHMELSLHALHYKYKYLKWAFNLPDGLVFSFNGWLNYLIALALLVFVMPFAFSSVRRLWKLDRLTWCGLIWFVIALSPVLLLRNLTMHHNLYMPLAGLALVFGDWLHGILERFETVGRAWACTAVSAFVIVFIGAVFFHNLDAVKHSWIAEASTIAETSLQDLKRLRPTIPDGTTIYVIDKSSLGGLRWYYDYGSLIRLFYASKSLNVQFIDRGGPLPDRNSVPKGAIFVEYDGSHLSEATGGI